jgi:hypothetical protein
MGIRSIEEEKVLCHDRAFAGRVPDSVTVLRRGKDDQASRKGNAMRVKIMHWVARALGLPYPWFELLPTGPKTFEELKRDSVGLPVIYNWEKMQEAVWPKPDRRYRIFVQVD